MGDHHPLGLAGGTRGENDLCQPLPVERFLVKEVQGQVVLSVHELGERIMDRLQHIPARIGAQCGCHEANLRLAEVHDVAQVSLLDGRVQGDAHVPRFHDGQVGQQEEGGIGGHQYNVVVLPVSLPYITCQGQGIAVELGIGHLLLVSKQELLVKKARFLKQVVVNVHEFCTVQINT